MQIKSFISILDNLIENYFKHNKSFEDIQRSILFEFNDLLYLIEVIIYEYSFLEIENSGEKHQNEIIKILYEFIKKILSSESQRGEIKDIIYNYNNKYPFKLLIRMRHIPECMKFNITECDDNESMNLLKKLWENKLYNTVLECFGHGISSKDLYEKTRYIYLSSIRKELLQKLIASNKIFKEKEKSKGRKPKTIYKARSNQ